MGTASSDTALSKNSTYACSGITNSYGKCVNEIAPKFSPAIAEAIRKAIGPHDQNSFNTKILIGDVSVSEMGIVRVTGKQYLYVRGTYEHKIFAHLKKIEAWIETEAV